MSRNPAPSVGGFQELWLQDQAPCGKRAARAQCGTRCIGMRPGPACAEQWPVMITVVGWAWLMLETVTVGRGILLGTFHMRAREAPAQCLGSGSCRQTCSWACLLLSPGHRPLLHHCLHHWAFAEALHRPHCLLQHSRHCHRPQCLPPVPLAHGHCYLHPPGGDNQRSSDPPHTRAQVQQQDEGKALLVS